jgi:hypothetical protein
VRFNTRNWFEKLSQSFFHEASYYIFDQQRDKGRGQRTKQESCQRASDVKLPKKRKVWEFDFIIDTRNLKEKGVRGGKKQDRINGSKTEYFEKGATTGRIGFESSLLST